MAVAEVEAVALDAKVPAQVRAEPEVNKLFRMVMKHEGSDLHMKVGLPPMMRLRNAIRHMEMKPVNSEEMERLLFPIMSPRSQKLLEDTGGADFAHVIGQDECRFRVNIFRQRGKLSLVARRVSTKVPTFEKLGLPPAIEKLCHYDQGMLILA